ncbi:AAA superfamily ATPase [Bifidobacterium lemurum]|uniref:AAA superfamily ATPase n=1 Tax=Bifidobacterium lemurum TaxID=1603886 RepID=A0A261FSK1_9BIFI|nr:DUF4143 domain-containing protein [Bifidobacterium lemurum]OZG61955.1 AAA superfamily ATPase [Bifidobacterium lemurum]QOL35266.1 ATP-binding protein [Bifidobacterium lemurum]
MSDNGYIPRIVDAVIDDYLAVFPAVSIEGPKWCGKTTTATQHSKSKYSLADPEGNFRNRTLARMEPALALEGETPRLIDEWQEVPGLWDAVRFACDQDTARGRFILTGSSTPRKSDRPMHSGAGRIARVHMSSMTLLEQGVSSGKVSLQGLFAGESYAAVSSLSVDQIALLVVRGGWPAALGLDARHASMTARSYLDAIADDDISEVDNVDRDPVRVRRLLASLGRNEATLASKSTLAKDTAEYDVDDPEGKGKKRPVMLSDTTLGEYLGALERMRFVEDIPAWHPALRSPVRIRSARKRHLADPSLAAAAIGATPESLRMDPKTLGFLFESLVTHDLKVYAQVLDAEVMHYRDDSNLEVDLIVETRDGAWGAFEVKLGDAQIDEGAENVNRLERKMVERGQRPASVKAVIVGTGAIAHRREDGVQVIPLDTLGV